MSSGMTWTHPGQGAMRLAGLALVAGILLAGARGAWASPAAAQGQRPGDQPCKGDVSGYLGIGFGDCRGCVLTVSQESKAWKKAWSFATEPRIAEIAEDSPLAGSLQVGDEIVAIDGVLITSAEAGQRFANVEPNRNVTIRYRRHGQTADVVVRAGTHCGLSVEGLRINGPFAEPREASLLDVVLSRLAPGMRVQLSQHPRIRIQADADSGDTTIGFAGGNLEITVPRKGPSTGPRKPVLREGRLGARFSCRSCSARSIKDGRPVWQFSSAPQVTGIEVGGPADLAGIRVGDRLEAVDGHPIESTKGGEAFSVVRSGQPMQLTLRGPDGRTRTVTVVPQARKPGGALDDTPDDTPDDDPA